MTVLIFSVVIFAIMFTAMMAGVLLGRAPIQGSCGGVGSQCSSCSKPCDKKKRQQQ